MWLGDQLRPAATLTPIVWFSLFSFSRSLFSSSLSFSELYHPIPVNIADTAGPETIANITKGSNISQQVRL
jgi:hypothetical protein